MVAVSEDAVVEVVVEAEAWRLWWILWSGRGIWRRTIVGGGYGGGGNSYGNGGSSWW